MNVNSGIKVIYRNILVSAQMRTVSPEVKLKCPLHTIKFKLLFQDKVKELHSFISMPLTTMSHFQGFYLTLIFCNIHPQMIHMKYSVKET